VEVERLEREYDVAVRWAPFFLDPSIPPEGRERTPQTEADTPKSMLEQMGEKRGIEFRRGRTFTPNSHLALQAAEFAHDHGSYDLQQTYHRALFKAHHTDHENIGDADVLVRLASEVGYDGDALRESLTAGTYGERVDDGIAQARSVGVTGIPTFIFNNQYAIVGAQEYASFEQIMARMGAHKRDGQPPPVESDLDDFD
jgi:predicted DsbA family dithiol-disulfide isomerase